MRKAALLLVGTLTLILHASIVHSSEVYIADPRYIFRVSLENDFPIRLSPRIHASRGPNGRDQFFFCDVIRALELDSFALWLKPDDGTRLISLDPFEGLEWDSNVFY